MLSFASKVWFAIAAFALVVAVAYAIDVSERGGVILLFAASSAALVGALVLIGAPDTASAADAGASTPVLDRARPSRWPVLVAASATMLAAGLATGAPLLIAGVLAVIATLIAWFGQAWSEHPSWTEHHAARVSDRGLMPVFLPLGVLALVGVIVISFSRVLLALPKAGSTLLALVAAVLILGVCSLVANRPSIGSSALTALAIVAGLSTVAAGVAGALNGEREFHAAGHEGAAASEGDHGKEDAGGGATGAGKTITITAKNVAFAEKTITLSAGAGNTIDFDNQEALPHNVSLYDHDKALFTGEIFSGPSKKAYALPKLKAGTYDFRCDVHPATMKGSVVVK